MAKYDGYLLATDFDGTFAMTEENLKAVRHFQENGGRFTIATGRSYEFIRSHASSFVPNAPVIAMNGTLILDEQTGAPLLSMPLDRKILTVLDALSQTGLPELIILNNAEGSTEWRRGDSCAPSERLRGLAEPWHKTILVQNEERTLALRDIILDGYGAQYCADRSWREGVEIHVRGSGKGACLKWVRTRLGNHIHTTIGAGDFENDISLVREADIGYAVGNAIDEVKAAADRITVCHSDHAIARIIEELG